MKNKKAYILYEYNQAKNDFVYLAEYYSIKELEEEEKKKARIKVDNIKSIYHGITKSIDSIKTLINDRYIIIKEDI